LFLFRADAWRDLAEVAHRVGEAEEAAAARATALGFYRAKGNVAAARQLARFRRPSREVEPVDGRRLVRRRRRGAGRSGATVLTFGAGSPTNQHCPG
jgi:hypothetical protein